MPIDLVITVMFIGLFHLAVGILIGRHLKIADEPIRPMFRTTRASTVTMSGGDPSLATSRSTGNSSGV
jgi:hypothetical protein